MERIMASSHLYESDINLSLDIPVLPVRVTKGDYAEQNQQ